MIILLLLALWLVTSLTLAAAWSGYRRFVGVHAVEDFEVPVESRVRHRVAG